MSTTVVNIRKQAYEVYIGRPGHGQQGYFGNPFVLGVDGDRSTVIKKYEAYFWKRVNADSEFRKRVAELKDKTLGCFCKPDACHGDVIVRWINAGCPTEQAKVKPATTISIKK